MLSSNPQDEAMLSERNEQDMFQSDSSSESAQSNEEANHSKDDKLDQPAHPNFQVQQNILKEETKDKVVKETCFEKLKGYIGFGSFLTSQKIGNVFFIPISNKWTFKTQVIVTQLIITLVSLGIFFGIKFIGQNIFKQIIQDWSVENFTKLQIDQMSQVSSDYIQLILIQQSNQERFVRMINDMFNQNSLLWYENLLLTMEDPLPDVGLKLFDPNLQIYCNLNQSTFTYLNETRLSTYELQQILSVNYILKYMYNSLDVHFYWIFKNGLMIEYPGINVSDIQRFKAYRQQIDLRDELINDFEFDSYLNRYIKRTKTWMVNSENEFIGHAYTEVEPSDLQRLFKTFAMSEMLNYTLVFLDKSLQILTDCPEYLKQAVLEVVVNGNLSDVFAFQDVTISKEQFHDFFGDEEEEEEESKHMSSIPKDQDSGVPVNLYSAIIDGTKHSFSVIKYDYTIVLIYPYTLLDQQIKDQNDEFEQYDIEFTERYLAVCIAVPLLYIVGVVYFLIREIKPLVQITQLAYMSLKKSQAFDETQLNSIKGDGLISNLTELFKNLMKNLNEMKLQKKKQIIDYYNQQTYPCNNKAKDVEPILQEIEKIRLMGKIQGNIKIPNLEE